MHERGGFATIACPEDVKSLPSGIGLGTGVSKRSLTERFLSNHAIDLSTKFLDDRVSDSGRCRSDPNAERHPQERQTASWRRKGYVDRLRQRDWHAVRRARNQIRFTRRSVAPTARVLAVLRELNDDVVRLEVTGDATWIRCGYSEFRLSAEDPADFPPVATFEDTDYFVVPAAALRTMIRRTIFATDSESTRYALGGIQMELGAEKLTLAATDSRRLAVVTTASSIVGKPAIPAASPVIPSKAMGLIRKAWETERAKHTSPCIKTTSSFAARVRRSPVNWCKAGFQITARSFPTRAISRSTWWSLRSTRPSVRQ